MQQICIIDPGMMEAGGHHAALLNNFLVKHDQANINIHFFVHQEIDRRFLDDAIERGFTVNKHFNQNFYEHFSNDSNVSLSSIQSYIRQLAIEYIEALKQYLSDFDSNTKIVCFYPSLNWDHACALNLALQHVKFGKLQTIHKICCMFSQNRRSNLKEKLQYQISFKNLSLCSNVELYASDKETLDYYTSLNIPMSGIHPCYLLPWKQIKQSETTLNTVPRILLYLGDAKKSKGFLTLPETTLTILKQFNFSVEVIIQFTLPWENLEIDNTIEELKKISNQYSQLKIYREFWSVTKLSVIIQSVDLLCCTHCPQAYQYKSSGLVWLASYFNIPVIVKGNCWLTRELDRLESTYYINAAFKKLSISIARKSKRNNYFRTLFNDLIDWLLD
ncbi:hypothetical protein [Glaciecola sp. 1036]|uniref:hypothetical protein n=1 Tax=Alteromonadaceae TaxID=72275 RepID=UPI003D08F4B2